MEIRSKIIENVKWISYEERESKFGGGPLPPRKPNPRRPLFWLARNDWELYLINESGETLDKIVVKISATLTLDDEVVPVAVNVRYEYENVKPGTAVQVDKYSWDDDEFLLQLFIKTALKKFGCMEFISLPRKPIEKETILLWDTGKQGPFFITNCNTGKIYDPNEPLIINKNSIEGKVWKV